jgi:hypothetical protein
MRTMNVRLGLLATILVITPVGSPAQQAKSPKVKITVSDPNGARIPHARIKIVLAPDNYASKLETDDAGIVLFEVAAGGYALFVSSPGFRPTSQHLSVGSAEDQASTPQAVSVTLQVGPTGSAGIYQGGSLVLVADPYSSPVALSVNEFHAMPHVTMKVHNSHTNTDETYAGVPLQTLLAKINAPIGKEFHEQALVSYVIAAGSDGYSVLLSLAEVDASFYAGQIIVADERDGQPLGKYGPFQLIVPGDSRSARWVHNLNFIKVQQAQ